MVEVIPVTSFKYFSSGSGLTENIHLVSLSLPSVRRLPVSQTLEYRSMIPCNCCNSTPSPDEEEQKRLLREILQLHPAPREDLDLETHPHDRTNCISEYTYHYQFRLMRKGNKKVIELSDLTAAPQMMQMNNVYEKFLQCVVPRYRPHCAFTFDVLRTALWFNRNNVIIIFLGNNLWQLTDIAGVIAFRELLRFLYTDDPIYHGLVFAAIIGVSKIISYLFAARAWVVGDRAGISVRNLLMGIILRKALLIPQYVLSRSNATDKGDNHEKGLDNALSTGQIVNLMSNDTERINEGFKRGVSALSCGINIIICLCFMIWLIGWEALGGFAIGILLVPFNIYFGKIIGSKKLNALVFSDERVKFLTELLNGIRVVKMYCWEKPLQDTIAEWRRKEIAGFKTVFNIRCLLNNVLGYSDYFVIVAILGLKVLLGKPIDVVEMYLVISLTGTIRGALNRISFIGEFIDAVVALLRIQKFMDIEDHYLSRKQRMKRDGDGVRSVDVGDGPDPRNGHTASPEKEEPEGPVLIRMENARFEHEPHLTLNRLLVDHLEIRRDELIAVIGSVGSGKSMLMESLLLETYYNDAGGIDSMFKFNQKSMKFAWVNQSFFIMNGTIRGMQMW